MNGGGRAKRSEGLVCGSSVSIRSRQVVKLDEV